MQIRQHQRKLSENNKNTMILHQQPHNMDSMNIEATPQQSTSDKFKFVNEFSQSELNKQVIKRKQPQQMNTP